VSIFRTATANSIVTFCQPFSVPAFFTFHSEARLDPTKDFSFPDIHSSSLCKLIHISSHSICNMPYFPWLEILQL